MQILLKDAIDLQKALNHLHGYKLSSLATKKISQNLTRLNAAFPDGDKKRSEILTECGNPAETDPGFKAVIEKTNAWLNETKMDVEFDLLHFAQFNIGVGDSQNHIPPVVIAHLAPMINFEDSSQ